jgi:CDP-diacylglycerol--glycerol-3-phosphate 3-phosphatidyltransferase
MSIYELKPAFQEFLRPWVKTLARAGITANQVTLWATLLSVATGLSLLYWQGNEKVFLLVPVVLFLRMALNAIDGMLARDHAMKSHLGAILNEMGDVVSDIALYIPFAYLGVFRPTLVMGTVILAILTEMIGVVTVQIGASRRYDGPMGKSDRAFVFSIMAILIALKVSIGPYGDVIFGLLILLLSLTIINRSAQALKEVT